MALSRTYATINFVLFLSNTQTINPLLTISNCGIKKHKSYEREKSRKRIMTLGATPFLKWKQNAPGHSWMRYGPSGTPIQAKRNKDIEKERTDRKSVRSFSMNNGAYVAKPLPQSFTDSREAASALGLYRSPDYSHSMVAGGLLVISYTTRLIPFTSLMMRLEMVSSTSYGIRAQSAVIKSLVVTPRRANV